MTLFQVVADDVFAASETKTVFFNSGYWFRGDVNPGKVIVKATLIKMDGMQVALPNLKEQLEFCCAARSRAIDQDLEPGDIIQWDIRLRRHSALLPDADCWSMTVGIATVE